MSTEPAPVYDINSAAQAAGFTTAYIRNLIRKGVIHATREPVREGSLVTRYVIDSQELDRFLNTVPHKSRREDSRNKFVMYATPDEFTAAIQALEAAGLHEVASLITPANKVKNYGKRT